MKCCFKLLCLPAPCALKTHIPPPPLLSSIYILINIIFTTLYSKPQHREDIQLKSCERIISHLSHEKHSKRVVAVVGRVRGRQVWGQGRVWGVVGRVVRGQMRGHPPADAAAAGAYLLMLGGGRAPV